MVTSQRGLALARRYATVDLCVFTDEETRRFLGGDGDPPLDREALAWELLYRLEPELYDRLVRSEPIHPEILKWLPRRAHTVVEVGAGTGRLTAVLINRCDRLIAVEPAAPMRALLLARLQPRDGEHLRVVPGFFDCLPIPDGSADLVVTCSALTPEGPHGGEAGLAEMERVCAPGGTVVIVWPNHREWLERRGYRYRSFPGEMCMEFANHAEAVELAEIFYPHAAVEVRRLRARRVPYAVLGVNPPRDLAYKAIAA